METNVKFNVNACLSYIDGIEDFTIEFESKPSYDEVSQTRTYVEDVIEVKDFLRTFIMKCEIESLKEEYEFVKWLRGRRRYWQVQQYHVMGSLNGKLERAEPDDKDSLGKKMRRYIAFYRHNCKLIEMMLGDVMNNYGRMPRRIPADSNRLLLDNAAIDSFAKLFTASRDAEPYFQLLRDHEYPLIGKKYNYLSKALKSGFCIWIYEMQREHIIEHQPDKIYADLLLKRIEGLKTFDVSLFRKTNNKAEERYGEYFRKRIYEVKAKDDNKTPVLMIR